MAGTNGRWHARPQAGGSCVQYCTAFVFFLWAALRTRAWHQRFKPEGGIYCVDVPPTHDYVYTLIYVDISTVGDVGYHIVTVAKYQVL